MKVSIITVVYNGEKYLEDAICSVLNQDYPDIEYIVVDGNSSDRSPEIISSYAQRIAVNIREPDKGMYDALNKGISRATGEIIGILNADDMLAGQDVVSEIVAAFNHSNASAVYGDLNYVDPENEKIIRRWRSKPYKPGFLQTGWMPAHPTLYVRKKAYDIFGLFSLDYGTAADYELMVRFFFRHRIAAVYLPKLIVKMRVGGQSNATWRNLFLAFKHDYRAARAHSITVPLFTIALKKLRKIKQFLP